MLTWFRHLDLILRGDVTRPDQLEKADLKIPLRGIAATIAILGFVHGICMGCYALFRGFENQAVQDGMMQMMANIVKVPALFLLTLLVTFPSLYVFNALVGSRLQLMALLRLLMAALGVNLAILASLGPIVAFFSVSTPNYSFVVLLNVAVFAVSGFLGLGFLIQTLNRMSIAGNRDLLHANEPVDVIDASTSQPPVQSEYEAPSSPSEEQRQRLPGPIDRIQGQMLGKHVKKVFLFWLVLFGIVGAQMGWVLRPFIGTAGQPFSFFRERDSNFFESIFRTLFNVFN